MALKLIRPFQILSFILILSLLFLPGAAVHAMTGPVSDGEFPSLDTFTAQVSNGHPDELRGVYVPGILAAPVVRQSAGVSDFVSPWQNVLTQFGLASRYGSTGLLAHNYLAGETFTLIENGQKVQLVYGDGKVATFMVTEIHRYQALERDNPSGTFLDLETLTSISSSSLFSKIYNHPGRIVFQTCIQAGDDLSWGRLFVIAEPTQ